MQIFKDHKLNKAFRKDGYVVVRIADPADLSEMTDLYNSLGDHVNEHSFYTTIWVDDKEVRKRVNDSVRDFVYPRVREILNDFSPVFGNFMVKHPGEQSAMGLHQDWTFVDEKKGRTVNTWLPITPITHDNGPLIVVPRSQHFSQILRGRNIVSPFDEIYNGIKDKYGKTIIVKQGEAVLFDNALMHASENNNTQEDRVAVSLVLKPNGKELIHYHRDASGKGPVIRSVIEPSFYVDYGLFDSLDDLKSKQEVSLAQKPYSMMKFRMQYFFHKYFG